MSGGVKTGPFEDRRPWFSLYVTGHPDVIPLGPWAYTPAGRREFMHPGAAELRSYLDAVLWQRRESSRLHIWCRGNVGRGTGIDSTVRCYCDLREISFLPVDPQPDTWARRPARGGTSKRWPGATLWFGSARGSPRPGRRRRPWRRCSASCTVLFRCGRSSRSGKTPTTSAGLTTRKESAMPFAFRPIAVKPVPKSAVVRTVNGVPSACWTDRRNRKVVAELTADGKRCRVQSPTWWVEYTTAAGGRERKKGFKDKAATLKLGLDLERRAEDVRSGRVSHRSLAAPGHMADYLPDFRAGLERKGNTAGHTDETLGKVGRVLKELALTTPGAVDRGAVERWLDGEQKAHRWSARTRNRWAGALNQFGRWLVKEGRAAANPFDGLARQNIEADRRWVRRVLDPEDLVRLIVAARDADGTFRGMSGPDRAMLYAVAAMTGRRLSALVQMTRADVLCDPTGRPLSVTTSARLQKSKKAHTVPVHPDLADDFGQWLATRPAKGPLWSGWRNWDDRGADMIRHDLAAARGEWLAEATDPAERERRESTDRLLFADASGEVFDFHALRTQFITSLAMADVPLTAAQQLADHSDPKLTANVYTKWKNKLAAEVAKVPGLGVRLHSRLHPGLGAVGGTPHNSAPRSGRAKTKKPRNHR